MNITRLTATSLKAYRTKLIALQKGKCVLCEETLDAPALDHCHKTGKCRGVLCRGCNAMLGHIENNRARHKLTDDDKLTTFLANVIDYLSTFSDGIVTVPYHPTFKTEEEKRLLRNKRARIKRQAAKEQTT